MADKEETARKLTQLRHGLTGWRMNGGCSVVVRAMIRTFAIESGLVVL